jgi:hypothetical protein
LHFFRENGILTLARDSADAIPIFRTPIATQLLPSSFSAAAIVESEEERKEQNQHKLEEPVITGLV